MNQERLMQVLLAPQISEKATYVADKNEQVIFRVASSQGLEESLREPQAGPGTEFC